MEKYKPVEDLRPCVSENCDNLIPYRFSQKCDECLDKLEDIFELLNKKTGFPK